MSQNASQSSSQKGNHMIIGCISDDQFIVKSKELCSVIDNSVELYLVFLLIIWWSCSINSLNHHQHPVSNFKAITILNSRNEGQNVKMAITLHLIVATVKLIHTSEPFKCLDSIGFDVQQPLSDTQPNYDSSTLFA